MRIKFIRDSCTACKTCELACGTFYSGVSGVDELIYADTKVPPRMKITEKKGKYRIVHCVHCKNPKCVDACEYDALTKRDNDGTVLLDEEKCTGCWKCIEACPFDAIWEPKDLDIAIKCNLCIGRRDSPACVESCPTEALIIVTEEASD